MLSPRERMNLVISAYVVVVHGEAEACRNGVWNIALNLPGAPGLWAGDSGSLLDRSLVCWGPLILKLWVL